MCLVLWYLFMATGRRDQGTPILESTGPCLHFFIVAGHGYYGTSPCRYLALAIARKKKRAIKKFLMSADNALFVRLGLTIELSPGTLLKDSVRGTNFIYLNSWKLGWKKMSLKAYTITLLESVKLSDYLTVTQKAFPWLQ